MSSLLKALNKALAGANLSEDEAKEAMHELMSGKVPPAQIASFLTALRMKGETVEEIAAFAGIMREFAHRIQPRVKGVLVDTCGTGGDKIKTFNISTCAMFVAAGAGVQIAKHGNRSVTSKSGSADVLEALGVTIDLPPPEVQRCIEKVGMGFMFAPRFHPAMKHATPVRREMKIRTVFNILGPLTNPASAHTQLMGVFDGELVEKLARVLGKLGCQRAIVVHGVDGLDEISTIGKTIVSELSDSKVTTKIIRPEDFDIKRASPSALSGGDATENARILLQILKDEKGPKTDIVLLNSAAAIVVGGVAKNLKKALELAQESISSGRAMKKLREFVVATGGNLERLKSLEEAK